MSEPTDQQPKNLGEMENADAVGTVGSADCGDMLRMWIKFREEGGKKIIDRATFQTFGCETAIAVASLATAIAVSHPKVWNVARSMIFFPPSSRNLIHIRSMSPQSALPTVPTASAL